MVIAIFFSLPYTMVSKAQVEKYLYHMSKESKKSEDAIR